MFNWIVLMIDWFTRNGVAANLLMFFIILLGARALIQEVPVEVFPDFDLDVVMVTVPYRGASPEEVEEAIVVRIEEAIHDLPGIKQITSLAVENAANVSIEVENEVVVRELLDDIKNRVDAITTFPLDAEKPIVQQAVHRGNVISVVVAGLLSEKKLRLLGEQVREDIVHLPDISQVTLQGVRPYEVAIEISENRLEQYGIDFNVITEAIRNSSLNIPAGSIKTNTHDILLRTQGQAYVREDFERIPVLVREDGSHLMLGDLGEVIDGFEETPMEARFNGKPAVLIDVFRVGDQNAIELAKTVKAYLRENQRKMPPDVELTYWRDSSKIVKDRLNTLLNSAASGGILVFCVLALFLRFSLAVWVCLGIPISFLGSIAFMPHFGVSINIISLFAFILVLGIVVDDAIVIGENIFTHLKKKDNPLDAASKGAKEMAVPVIFGVLTTMVAFSPLMMIGGVRGKLFLQIPLIVIPVLLFSLLESQLILPFHLTHLKLTRLKDNPEAKGFLKRMALFQEFFSNGLETFILKIYQPLLKKAMHRRYLTLSLFVGTFILLIGLILGGRIRFVYFPRVQSEYATAQLSMPSGTSVNVTRTHVRKMEKAAWELSKKHIDPKTGKSVIENILSTVGAKPFGRRGGGRSGGLSHLGGVSLEIMSPENRSLSITSSELVREWRKKIGPIPGAQEVTFRAEIGRGGDPVNIQLMGQDFKILRQLTEKIKTRLNEYPGIFDVTDTFDAGVDEIQLSLKENASLLGFTTAHIATQVREAFFGKEVQRFQRGRDDVRVMLRYPKSERRSLTDLSSMSIRSPQGERVPFESVAEIEKRQSLSSIRRIDRVRTVNVTADANKQEVDLQAIYADLHVFLSDVMESYPGVQYAFEGEAREQKDSFQSLKTGMILVLFMIYAMLAIPFKSYVKPLIVMSVIPFGLMGSVLGHMFMGLNLSIMSIFGMLALMGVVVNDSLVLVDYVNRRRREGIPLMEAVKISGVARFRPIMLTSITTFFGLIPLILEKSTQAQFLIPMAVSLGFGILFATLITLFLIPINYLLLEDLTGSKPE